MTVPRDTADYYRYFDLTGVTEGLFELMEETLVVDLVAELDFLVAYDRAKTEAQRVVDLPDRLLDLFIRFVIQNQGTLSGRKRDRHFQMLTDDEIGAMETAVSTTIVVQLLR